MSKNDFDELLLKKLQSEEFEYNPASWDKLSGMLPPEQNLDNTKAMPFAGSAPPSFWQKWKTVSAAAAVLLAGSVTWFVMNQNGKTTQDIDVAVVTKNVTKPTSNERKSEQPQISNSIGFEEPIANNNSYPQLQNTRGNTPLRKDDTEPPHSGNGEADPVIQQPIPIAQLPQSESVLEKITPQEQQTQIASKTEKQTLVAQQTVKQEKTNFSSADFLSDQFMTTQNNSGARTSVAIGGGMNYGNTNTGYSAGVSVKQKIAGKLFVDGSVAMVYNNNASNIVVNNGKPLETMMSDLASKPASGKSSPVLPTPAIQPIQKLYYMQVNPSLGYQVQKNVSVSIGGDFQRIINVENETVQVNRFNDNKILPKMDVGLTTKSEINVTPNLQAGVLYRQGVNNLFKQDAPVQYVNRRYFQVQFKYSLPIR